jgi:hypothetical protein
MCNSPRSMTSVANFLSQILWLNNSFDAIFHREPEGDLYRRDQMTSQIYCVLAIADQCLSLFLRIQNVALSENGLGDSNYPHKFMAFLSLQTILRWFLWGYRSLSFVSELFSIIILRSLYHRHCMTNAGDKTPSNIQVMNQPTPLYRTLAIAGLRRENLGRILQSCDDLLNVVAPRS